MSAMIRPLPERSTTFREQADLPLLSPKYCATRNRLLGQIRGEDVPDDVVLRFIEIEITGLELLRVNSEDEHSDFSFDSYCEDSFEMGQARRDAKRAVPAEPINRVSSSRRQRAPRRLSCSSIEEDPITTNPMSGFNGEESSTKAMDYGYGRFARRASMGSNDNSSAGYSNNGRPSRFTLPASRRSSLGSYANDSLNEGHQVRMNRQASRRSSIGSYANDSVDYGYGRPNRMNLQASRRSSIGSYANDSVDYGKGLPNRMNRQASRRSSIGSYANDSVDYGNGRSTRMARQASRRSSIGSYANDSVEYGRRVPRPVGRRSSIGSNANESVDYGYGRHTPRAHRSSIGSNANDSVDHDDSNDLHDQTRFKAPRRSSLDSFSNESYSGKQVQSRRGNNPIPPRAQPRQQRRFSNYSDYANDSVEAARQNKSVNVQMLTSESAHSELKQRRISLVSTDGSGFTPEVFSTQSINTGGANRAA